MRQRIITAVVALIIFIPLLIAGGVWLELAAAVLGVIGLSEFYIMQKRIIVSPDFVISAVAVVALVLPKHLLNWLPNSISQMDVFFLLTVILLVYTVLSKNRTNFDEISVNTLATLYVGMGFHALASVRNNAGLDTLFFFLLVVWMTDSGAYIFGRKLGKHKLWPAISPNKTWEGSICGTLLAVVVAVIYVQFFPQLYSIPAMIGLALLFSVIGQLGDLVESAYKRYYGVKDSGKILPGHGGILDRFDSLLLVLPLLHFFGFF
ncbi:phosphatidate cytidylyltransferase [Agrilactobacillus yilanensis]|uniref:Phosphatidate cytidylyltransferase n=1 Tax=Agrilactobacillus yilanensis TaxID=2485997 RepID=A0ABW4J9F3_9LACO|nr:phosphatidate cytidylyltransferase [Agrilactobacillus yilanensis]